MADHERVISSDGTPLSATLKTKRDRKHLVKPSNFRLNDKIQYPEARSYLPDGYIPRVGDYVWDHPEPEQEGGRMVSLPKGQPSKSNRQKYARRIRQRAE